MPREQGCALFMNGKEAKALIEEAVSNSTDLVEAMESIGAMYGIPSTNIMGDDSINSVKIVNDHIVCPTNKSAIGNTDTIVRAIAAVLDRISQRVDEKVNGIQAENSTKGQYRDNVSSRTDPSKGKVVGTYQDDDGEPVIVYDSGIIDCARTPAGHAKAQELRKIGNIPTYDPLQKKRPTYFTDEDDVLAGIATTPAADNINADLPDGGMTVNSAETGEPPTVAEGYNISAMIGAEDYFLDAIGRYGDTKTLGFDVFSSQGYRCVRPIGSMYQESDSQKKVNPEDIKHMKFDNTNIYKAIDYLNKARAEQPMVKHVEDLNMDAFVRSENYQKAIECLEKQFNAHIAVKWIHAKKEESTACTQIWSTEYRSKLTVSKSKGFQLGGAPIHIFVLEDGVASLIPDDPKLFGQSVCAIFLHEIFHNIAGIIRYDNGQMVSTMNLALNAAMSTRDPKTRRIIIEKYVDTLNATTGHKLNRMTRKILVKRICAFATIQSDTKLIGQYQKAVRDSDESDNKVGDGVNQQADKELRIMSKVYRNAIKKNTPNRKGATGMIVTGIISTIAGVLTGGIGLVGGAAIAAAIGAGVGAAGIGLTITGGVKNSTATQYEKLLAKYKNSKDMEEYYSDLMSAMYQLPQRFFTGVMAHKYSANEVSQEALDEWVDVERCAYESLLFSNYPTTSERTYAGTTVAQNLLKCKNLHPEVKKYCQWIVDNNSNILKTGIDEKYNSTTFDPKEAEDLDQHLLNLIKDNNVTVTEQAMKYLVGDSIYAECDVNGS